ncbi:MAG: transposase [Proteobacteria bacterium]|nr:transposase [Pseudomonadota bacterium]MBU1611782.1 transposase [Pseudomonadota bacterium]
MLPIKLKPSPKYHHRKQRRMEGMNNKIKMLKRQAYGYRNLEFFKLRIMGIHEARYTQTG